MWADRHCESRLPPRSVMAVPSTSIVPRVGVSSPPSKFSSVVLPDPDGPMSARKSPLVISRLPAPSTSMRSPPRVKYLWTSWMRTSGVVPWVMDVSLHDDLVAVLERGWRRQDNPIAALQSGTNLDAVAVLTAGL